MIDQYELDPVRRKKTIRSLVGYAKQVKRSIFLGLTLLFLAVGAELAGPYIAKIIIDEHIVAIESEWVTQLPRRAAGQERLVNVLPRA